LVFVNLLFQHEAQLNSKQLLQRLGTKVFIAVASQTKQCPYGKTTCPSGLLPPAMKPQGCRYSLGITVCEWHLLMSEYCGWWPAFISQERP